MGQYHRKPLLGPEPSAVSRTHTMLAVSSGEPVAMFLGVGVKVFY